MHEKSLAVADLTADLVTQLTECSINELTEEEMELVVGGDNTGSGGL